MRQRLIRYFFLSFFLLTGLVCFSNSAQPGIWNAGGIPGNYVLLYPEDSAGFKKVQMRREVVSIQLYRGFAVVKGEYWMYNSSNETINIKTGYPINSLEKKYKDYHKDYYRRDVRMDDLHGIKVFVDSVQISQLESVGNDSEQDPNWYVWETEFKPESVTKITVYFIVNTNDASITPRGDKQPNGFIYLLETGATWKGEITKGDIYIQLMEDLKLKDIVGSEPDDIFSYNEEKKILKYSFENLIPTFDNNIVLTYGKHDESFGMRPIIMEKETYFKAIDELSPETAGLKFDKIELKSPYKLPKTKRNILGVLCLASPFILLTLLVVGIIAIAKRMKRKNH